MFVVYRGTTDKNFFLKPTGEMDQPEDTKSLRECPVCNEDFNKDTRCPRSLPCSHYLCTDCIGILIKKNKKQCPFCRQNFNDKSVQDIPINRALLDLMNCATPQSNCNRKQGDINATLGYLKEETSEAIESLFLNCVIAKSEAESSLQRVDSTNQIIQFSDEKIEEVTSKLAALGEENCRKKNTLEKENKELKESLTDLQKLEDKLSNIKLKLDAAKTFVETGTLMDEVKTIKADIKKIEEKLKGLSSGDKLQQELEKDVQKAKQNLCKILEVVDSMKIERNLVVGSLADRGSIIARYTRRGKENAVLLELLIFSMMAYLFGILKGPGIFFFLLLFSSIRLWVPYPFEWITDRFKLMGAVFPNLKIPFPWRG